MTDPTASTPSAASPPAGWYPDPAGSSSERYWGGSEWTAQLRSPAAPSGTPAGPVASGSASPDYGVPRYEPYRADIEKAPAGTSTNTPWIWIIVLLPLVSLAASATIDWRDYFEWSLSVSTASSTTVDLPESAGAIAIVSVLSWVFYFATVLLAFFDFRALRSRGVVKPFHWAWAFLGTVVYVIGRSVVVRRRTGGGLAPLWVYIAVFVITFIVQVVQIGSGVSAVIDQVPSLTDPS